ncbi:serine hydrolase [Paenibacillus sp. FSL R10-2782]|uniref:serine hydrolase n=1 Tax=Paenibacillus sp. FSL R10-2782 TaxID=2954661 RepID=UPI0031597B5F
MKRKQLVIIVVSLAAVLIMIGLAAVGLPLSKQDRMANTPDTVQPATAIAAEAKDETIERDSAHRVLRFLEEHPEKASITILRDGKKLAGREEHRMMPLASTVKTVIAVEYVKQAAAGTINPNERIRLTALERFYLPRLDGGAHSAWMKEMEAKGRVKNGTVSLREVAKGMIRYNSNANTEYLMDRLGLEQINQTKTDLGLQDHDPIYPFVSSILIPYEWMRETQGRTWGGTENSNSAKAAIQAMSDAEFRQHAQMIHNKLRRDVSGSYKKSAAISTWYGREFDPMNTERFIASTTADYASLMSRLNSRQCFSKAEQKLWSEVMEQSLDRSVSQKWLKHSGQKGGSNAYVLTLAMYAMDKEGHSTEMAVFFKDLDPFTNASLQNMMNEFKEQLLRDESFRKEINQRIGVQVEM